MKPIVDLSANDINRALAAYDGYAWARTDMTEDAWFEIDHPDAGPGCWTVTSPDSEMKIKVQRIPNRAGNVRLALALCSKLAIMQGWRLMLDYDYSPEQELEVTARFGETWYRDDWGFVWEPLFEVVGETDALALSRLALTVLRARDAIRKGCVSDETD